MIYNAYQAAVIINHLPRRPDWFVVGGPADGNEAQWVARRFPSCKIVGVEPSGPMRDYQAAHGFPGVMVAGGLADRPGRGVITHVDEFPRSSTMVRDVKGRTEEIDLFTVDQLSATYGPFTNCVLWLDVEGMEYRVLLGAAGLLGAGHVILVNVEVMTSERPNDEVVIRDLLTSNGFVLRWRWDQRSGNHEDQIWVRR